MRAKIYNTRDILGIIALAFAIVLIYSILGAMFLHAQNSNGLSQSANNSNLSANF
jgi:hypothetical protein